MNIALVPSSFHPHLGGVEELSRQLALSELKQGHRVMVATNRWPKNLPAREEFQGFPLHRYIFRVPCKPGRISWAANILGPFALSAFCSDLRSFNTEIIHVQCVSSCAYYAVTASRRLNLPLVVTLQGELTMDAAGIYQQPGFSQDLLRNVLDQADAITGCSQKTLDDAQDFYGKPFGNRASVIFNGANTADFNTVEPYSHDRPYILALGRMVPQKGFDILINTLACDELKSHDLLLAGDGPELDNLKQLANQLGLSNRVHFVGRADRPKVIALFKGCDVFALPSRADEGLPVVVAEALSAGKPTIATRSGGTPEAILHNITGLIVEKEDIAALRSALIELLRNPARREQMSLAARDRSKLFDWTHIASEYTALYQGVTSKSQHRAIA